MPSLRSFEKQTQNGVQGADLLEESPVKAKGCEALQRARLPWPLQEEWGTRVSQRGWASATVQAWLEAAPGEMDLCANQGTSGHSRGAASGCSLAGLSHPSLGSAQEWTEPRRRRDQSSISRGGSQSLGVTEQVSSPGEGKEVASGISGQESLLLLHSQAPGAGLPGFRPWSAVLQGLSVCPK